MTGKKGQNVCHFAFTEDVKVAENIQSWWDIETYASKINIVSQSKIKERAASSEIFREHDKVYRRAVRSGHALE